MIENQETFLKAISGAIHHCEWLSYFGMARVDDSWRPDHEEIEISGELKRALAVVVYEASKLKHNMGRHHPDAYRSFFNVEPDPRTYEEWSRALAKEWED